MINKNELLKDIVIKACPVCRRVPDIAYACGEYFVLPVADDCWFCEGIDVMHSSYEQEAETWNSCVDDYYVLVYGENLI